MSEPTWLPRIAECESVYFVRAEDGLEEEDDDIYLALTAENGHHYGLQLSPDAWGHLYDLLTTALQSSGSPLRAPDDVN